MNWTASLISKLLLMIHTQWVYRNNIVHKRNKDGLKKKERAFTLRKIQQDLTRGPRGLKQEDKFLFDSTFEDLLQLNGIKKTMAESSQYS